MRVCASTRICTLMCAHTCYLTFYSERSNIVHAGIEEAQAGNRKGIAGQWWGELAELPVDFERHPPARCLTPAKAISLSPDIWASKITPSLHAWGTATEMTNKSAALHNLGEPMKVLKFLVLLQTKFHSCLKSGFVCWFVIFVCPYGEKCKMPDRFST